MKIKDFLKKYNLASEYPKKILEFDVLLLVRAGSHAYGTNIKTSDEDFRGIFMIPQKYLLGLNYKYIDQLTFGELDDKEEVKADNVFYELGRFMDLLRSSNPNILEVIMISDENLIYRHPILDVLVENSKSFFSKECHHSVGGYARAQIMKAKSKNKFQNWKGKQMERLSPLDFCTAYIDKDEMPLTQWLIKNNINQNECGIAPVPHTYKKLKDFTKYYGTKDIWYSLSFHLSKQLQILSKLGVINFDGISGNIINKLNKIECDIKVLKDKQSIKFKTVNLIFNAFRHILQPFYQAKKSGKGKQHTYKYMIIFALFHNNNENYKGIVKEWEDGTLSSNELRMSNISKNEQLKCIFSYDMNGYSSHCKNYQSYQLWLKERNIHRWTDTKKANEGKVEQIGSKNMMHCVRLMIESRNIAEYGEIKVRMPKDIADRLIGIRKGEEDLKQLIDWTEKEIKIVDKLYDDSTLPDNIDIEFVNDLLLNIRLKYYKENM